MGIIGICVRVTALLVLVMVIAPPVMAQSNMVPEHNGSCPSGSNHAGAGYCRSSGSAYIPSHNGSCPSGTNHAGANYCRTDGHTTYVREHNGSCPSGTNHVGSGYCRGR